MFNQKAITNHPAYNTESYGETSYHQAILNVAYADWQAAPEWLYGDMLDNAETQYGEVAKLAVMVGKYNQQVTNGGHNQYWDNGYATTDEETPDLHTDLIQLLEKYADNINSQAVYQMIKVMKKADFELDDEEYVEEWDDFEEEYVDESNEYYGSLVSDNGVADSRYYEICDEVMEDLEAYFKALLEGQDPTPNKPTEKVEMTDTENTGTPEKVKMKLVGMDGNAFVLMGGFSKAAKRQGWSKEQIDKVLNDCKSGDYNHLLRTLMDNTTTA